jgi:hypothetical protein
MSSPSRTAALVVSLSRSDSEVRCGVITCGTDITER